jgi:hypothetical protein
MYLAYGVTLAVLFAILTLLWKEEKRFRDSVTHGLANKYWILRERRRYVRFDEELKIRYNFRNKPLDFQESKATNVSKKGLCLVSYEKLKEKIYLDLEMKVPGFSKPLKLIGQVVWVKDLQKQDDRSRRLFYTGIMFSKVCPESEAILLAHLSTLKNA